MKYPIDIDTISMELTSLYLNRLSVKMSLILCVSVPEDIFVEATIADPDEMLPNASFHLGVHCLTQDLFTGIQNEND